ncbi:MAG: flagellar export protein FliJ [Treponema sp.]|nr:flagellar export protein FliJ [Treponema sp.]
MKKFSFELEKILEFRNFEKQEAEAELAKALSKENEIKSNLEMIAKQMIISNQSVDKSGSFDDVIAQSRYNNLLNHRKEESLKELAKANLVTEEKRSVLAECMKKTVALEKLKEKRKEEWKTAYDYEEAEEIDEASSHLKSEK